MVDTLETPTTGRTRLALVDCDLHSELQNNRTLQDNALTLLVNELTS